MCMPRRWNEWWVLAIENLPVEIARTFICF
jgi:hypothetical protein